MYIGLEAGGPVKIYPSIFEPLLLQSCLVSVFSGGSIFEKFKKL